MSAVAGAKPVRDEDSFDVEKVADWLRTHAGSAAGLDGVPDVQQFSGGASNLTYLLRFPTRDLVLRRAPVGTKAQGAHDMRREYVIQSSLEPVFPYVAGMIAFCDDPAVLGGDFYVMDRLTGVVPGRTMPVRVSEEQARGLCQRMIEVLVELHAVDPAAAGLDELGKGNGYVARQVEGWSVRFRNARTEDNPDYEDVMAWLDAHQPEDVGNCLIHNDYKLDNLVLDETDPTKVVGILDWEMATLGDPLMDLASGLAYWVEAGDDAEFQLIRRMPTHLPGMMTRAEIVAEYTRLSGIAVTDEQWLFYEVFGLFRIAGIVQQIWYRYFHKQTTNEAFALFGAVVQIIERRLQGLIA